MFCIKTIGTQKFQHGIKVFLTVINLGVRGTLYFSRRLLEICNFGQSFSTRKYKKTEDPSTPLQKPQEEVEDPGREVGPTGKIIIKLKTQK
jgi:hypothetical protein